MVTIEIQLYCDNLRLILQDLEQSNFTGNYEVKFNFKDGELRNTNYVKSGMVKL